MKKAVLKFMVWGAGVVLLLSVLIVLAGAFGLSWLGGSDAGRDWIAGQISELASSDDLSIELREIKTLNSRKVEVSTITFKDQDGEFAKLINVELDYVAEHLLAGNLHINHIGIEDIQLSRMPKSEETENGNTLPEIPALHIEAFKVEHITLASEITGKEEMLALEGALLLAPILQKSEVTFRLQDKKTGDMLADVVYKPDPKTDQLTLKAVLQDEGKGLLARLSGLPMIDISLEGEGSLEQWQGQLSASTGEDFQTQGHVTLDLSTKTPSMILTSKVRYSDYVAEGETTLSGHPKTKTLDMVFKGALETPDFKLEDIMLTGQGKFQNDRIQIMASHLKTPLLDVSAKGFVDLTDNTVELATKTKVADLKTLSPDFSGAASLEAKIKGGLEPLNLQAPVLVQTQSFNTIWDEVNQALGGVPMVKATLTYADDTLSIKEGVLNGLELKAFKFFGSVSESETSFNMVTNYLDHDIKTVLSMKGRDLVFEPISVAGDLGALRGKAAYNLDQEKLQATLTLKPDDDNIFSTKLFGPLDDLSYTGDWQGAGAYPFTFNYEGAINTQQGMIIKLAKFQGGYKSNRLSLKSPAYLNFTDAGARFEGVVMGLNDGTVKTSGQFGAKEFEVGLTAENLSANLDIFPFIFDGRVAGHIRLSGPYTNPVGEAQFDLKRITILGIDDSENRYVDGKLTASYKNHLITADTNLSGPAELKFMANGSLPLTLSPLELPFDKPISAVVDASVDLKALSLLLGLDEHSISGRSTLDVNLSGTLNKPVISGGGNLRNGTYENLLLGTNFKEITGDFIANDNRLTLENLEGEDTNGGRFSGIGYIDFKNIRDPQYQLTLDTKNLQLVNTDRMGMTASGQLKTTGDLEKADVKGQVIINQAEYYIAQIISTSSLSSFTIIEENGNGEEVAQVQTMQNGPDIGLSIGIQADHSVFVRAPDLETEWSGKINVGGTAQKLELKGGLSLVRGKFQLLDTPVQLSKGTVKFINRDPANPDVNVSGTIKGREMNATLKITGEAQSPDIGLQSDPPLPEDEILAKTLFGTSVNQLSPVQALRIAQLMAYLSGRQSAAFDPLNDIRRSIGIDTLSVGMDEEKGATLSVGKYVSDKVYIAVDQGTTPGSSAVRAEIEVTDDIELETRTNSTNESSVGVNWKKDY